MKIKHILKATGSLYLMLMLTGCATMKDFFLGKRNPISTNKIAVISTLGDKFAVQCVGTTVFSSRDFDCYLADQSLSGDFALKAQSILLASGYNATLQQDLRLLVGTEKSMMGVRWEQDTVDSLLAELSKRGYTALVLISDWRADYYDGARQIPGALHDVGLCSSSMFNLMRQSFLYASIEVQLYDVRDPENSRVERESGRQTITLEDEWPKSFGAIPSAKRAEYRATIKKLVDDQLDGMVVKIMRKI